jgi:hypothetical protein
LGDAAFLRFGMVVKVGRGVVLSVRLAIIGGRVGGAELVAYVAIPFDWVWHLASVPSRLVGGRGGEVNRSDVRML